MQMNSYNEKLHTTLTGLLKSFESKINAIDEQYKAAAQGLNAAQLAAQFAGEEYSETEKNVLTKKAFIQKAIECNRAGINALNSMTQLKACCNETVTEASVNAANIQTATNDILSLTSDMGSIYSTIQATDMDSQIFELGQQSFKKIEEVARLSEEVLQLSMEVAVNTAEITAPALLDKIEQSNSLLNNLRKKLTDSQQEALAKLAEQENILTETGNSEALATANFKNILVLKNTIGETYALSNEIINQQLQVKAMGEELVISFNNIQAPFKEEKTGQIDKSIIYPVKSYCLFFVKQQNKELFNLNKAEQIKIDGKDQYVQINLQSAEKAIKVGKKSVTCTISPLSLKYKDSDGDAIKPDTNYVVFLMAEYEEVYKREKNDFSDYLSAPSLPFRMVQKSVAGKKSRYLNKQPGSLAQEIKDSNEDIRLLETTLDDLNNKLLWMQEAQLRARTYGSSILAYRNDVLQIIDSVNDLNNNIHIARLEINAANTKIKQLAKMVNPLLQKLLFAIDIINKLSNVVTRKKALNPLISDELLTLISSAGVKSNKAFESSLLCWQGAISILSASNESVANSKQAQLHTADYYRLLAGDKKKQSGLSYLISSEQNASQQKEQQLIKELNLLQTQIEKTKQELSKAYAKYQAEEMALNAIMRV